MLMSVRSSLPIVRWRSCSLCSVDLMCSYHPDKPTGSVEKFRDIEKAYRILTDEIARANYERYGNPDGPTSMKVCVENGYDE